MNVVDDLDERTDVALIALLLLGGRRERPSRAATEAAGAVLGSFGGLGDLARADGQEIERSLESASVPHVQRAALAIAAAFELGRRVVTAQRVTPERITCSNDAAAWAIPRIGSLTHEELWMLAIDGRSRLRAARCVAKGGLHGAAIRTADALRMALRTAATGFVLVHNHPSGDATPSAQAQDEVFTKEIAAASTIVGVPLLDHIVVTSDGFERVAFGGGAA